MGEQLRNNQESHTRDHDFFLDFIIFICFWPAFFTGAYFGMEFAKCFPKNNYPFNEPGSGSGWF